MKKLNVLALAGLTMLFMACAEEKPATDENADANTSENTDAPATPVNYTVDTELSSVTWKGTMLGLYSHEGTVNITEGIVMMTGSDVTGGKIGIDMTSITPTDAGYSEEKTPEMLVQHLSSDDFFSVENFPTAMFALESVKEGTGTGSLTLRGNSNSEEITGLTVAEEEGTVKISGTMTFDRKKYEVAFDHPAEDMVISDDIELSFVIVGKSGS